MALDFSWNSVPGSSEKQGRFKTVEGSCEIVEEGPRSVTTNRWFKLEGPGVIRSVTVLPPRDETQERKFSLHLRIGSKHDPSSQLRRTGNVEGLELEVEEKDLQPLSRLVGRRIVVHFLSHAEDLRADALEKENDKLRTQILNLTRRLRAVQDQLQFTVEAQVRDSR